MKNSVSSGAKHEVYMHSMSPLMMVWCDNNNKKSSVQLFDVIPGGETATRVKYFHFNPFTAKGEFDYKPRKLLNPETVQWNLKVWPLKWKLSMSTF